MASLKLFFISYRNQYSLIGPRIEKPPVPRPEKEKKRERGEKEIGAGGDDKFKLNISSNTSHR